MTRSPSGVTSDDSPAPPYLSLHPEARANSWEDVSDLYASLGKPLDEWQDLVLQAAMGERADGRWASKFVGLSTPRQNGKSELIVARALAGILLFGEKMIIISAHETDTARLVWKRLTDIVESNPSLERRVTGRMDAINREYIAFGRGVDQQVIKLKARRRSGSRGFSADCLLLDEAQILGKAAWGSIVPTMSAMPNPQIWLFGTPPVEGDDPYAFTKVRESSLAQKARHCWVEWAATPKDPINHPKTWKKANPAYGVRISYEACADDRAAMDDEQFSRERLGMWPGQDMLPVFGAGRWEACSRPMSPDAKLEALGIAVSVNLDVAALVAAGREPGQERVVVQPLQHGPHPHDWLVERAVLLHKRFGAPVAIDAGGPGAVFIPALKQELGDALIEMKTGDVLDACANLYSAVRREMVEHDDYEELNNAVKAAAKRDVRDRWAWGRRKSSEEITALEGATWAVWAVDQDVTYESAYADGHELIVI